MIKYPSGPSNFWRCPDCRAILQKGAQLGSSGATTLGTVSCGNCGHVHPHSDIYGGKYDLPEVELNCPRCQTHLRGPKDELLGSPCPACDSPLPEERTLTLDELAEIKDSADVEVYRVGLDGEAKKTTVASLMEREKARQDHERGVAVMDRGDYRSAVSIFKAVLEATADNPDPMCYLNIAVCHAHLGEFKQSLSVLEDALRLWPDNARLRMNYEGIKRDAR
jgi:hypothetical protein